MDVDYGDITCEGAVAFCLTDPDKARQDILTLLQTMIRNRCENFGDGLCRESHNIKVLRDYLEEHGLKVECHARPERPERLNLIASIGSGSPRAMLGPAHVDVVPVTPDDASQVPPVYSGWKEDPWSGTVKDGEVYGRGSVDMLSTVATMAVAFVSVKESGVKLNGTLLFCAVSDEEAGGEDGVKFLLSDPGLKDIFQADYCVTELGGASIPDFRLRPTLSFFQSTAEKGNAILEVTLRGRPGHGSVPKAADNALVRAAEAVRRINAYQTPTVITPEWTAFVRALQLPFPIGCLLMSRACLPYVLRLLLSVGSPVAPVGHALTRMTLSPNALDGAVKYNVVPGTCTVTVDCRTLPGQDEEYILRHVRMALGPGISDDMDHCSIRMKSFTPATRSKPDTPLWRAMEKSASDIVKGATLVPVMLPGSTDCRFYRGLGGAVAYGANLFEPSLTFGTVMRHRASPEFIRPRNCVPMTFTTEYPPAQSQRSSSSDITKRFHGLNERLSLRSLWTSVQFYSLVVKHLMTAEDSGVKKL